ncbi:MAG: YggS family pyridoxal phosphate enzyme [Thermomicrobiales bacterium]|nr:MAG: YggS family pyridoxal phosphate enzyme [Thermomicrobiales bacterium]
MAQRIVTALEERLARVQEEVAEAALRSGRSPRDITIVAVTKTVGRAAVDEAYALGVRHFGENRVQDARQKFAEPLPQDASLHLIGQLQTNKAKYAVSLFDIIESVDRPSLIDELERQGAKRNTVVRILLEVNVSGEEQKAGCAPTDALSLVAHIERCPHLHLLGLMTMAPLVDDPELTRPVFRALRELRDRLCDEHPERQLSILSMGMSNDFPIAIEEGATHVRIGRAIFGN